jgi:hypothetical protein
MEAEAAALMDRPEKAVLGRINRPAGAARFNLVGDRPISI